MIKSSTNVRVRYAETDQMGVVYYGNYAQYLEIGRVEFLRDMGLSYREMEENGVMLPVLSMEVKYIKSAKYDDFLTIITWVEEVPHTRITFFHEIFNEEQQLLTKGKVQLVFLDKIKNRPTTAPSDFLERVKQGFNLPE